MFLTLPSSFGEQIKTHAMFFFYTIFSCFPTSLPLFGKGLDEPLPRLYPVPPSVRPYQLYLPMVRVKPARFVPYHRRPRLVHQLSTGVPGGAHVGCGGPDWRVPLCRWRLPPLHRGQHFCYGYRAWDERGRGVIGR